jgi:hypothetical protein
MPNKNTKKNQDLLNNPINILFLLYGILGVIFTSSIIFYLNKLKSCQCFQVLNNTNHSSINYLIGIESFVLTVFIILVLVFSFVILIVNNKKNNLSLINNNLPLITKNLPLINNVNIIANIMILLLLLLFCFNVYKLYQNIDEECECSKSWIRYLLYFQVFVQIINMIVIFIRILS